jgi:hypothetical protein
MIELEAGFDCSVCRQRHATLPLSFCCEAPGPVAAIPAWQRKERVVLTADQCVIDNTYCYLRGRIVIPILDCDLPFVWGVWAQVSGKHFYGDYKRWHSEGRERGASFPGRLANDLARFGSPAGAALEVQTQPVGRRPHFLVSSERSPLGREQRLGITLARAEEIATLLLHPSQPAAQASSV